ncbi:MAG: hypothetical protein GY778_22455 [bacterium]|nr:hypothetical protein [bacterium]
MFTKALLVGMVGHLAVGAWVMAADGRPSGVEIGQAFPTMILPSLDAGRPASIMQFRGQKVVLHIFASW